MNCSTDMQPEPEDRGSIFVARDTPDSVTVTVRSPRSNFESKVTLPFEVWKRIALPPYYAVSVAGDWS